MTREQLQQLSKAGLIAIIFRRARVMVRTEHSKQSPEGPVALPKNIRIGWLLHRRYLRGLGTSNPAWPSNIQLR